MDEKLNETKTDSEDSGSPVSFAEFREAMGLKEFCPPERKTDNEQLLLLRDNGISLRCVACDSYLVLLDRRDEEGDEEGHESIAGCTKHGETLPGNAVACEEFHRETLEEYIKLFAFKHKEDPDAAWLRRTKTCDKCSWGYYIKGDKLTGHIWCPWDQECHFKHDTYAKDCSHFRSREDGSLTCSESDEALVQGGLRERVMVKYQLPLIDWQKRLWKLENQPKKITEECWEFLEAVAKEDWDNALKEAMDIIQTVNTAIDMIAHKLGHPTAGLAGKANRQHIWKLEGRGLI